MTPEEVRAGVRAARMRKGLTQKEFADLAGVQLRTYWAYEAGKTRPQGTTMEGILAAAGMAGETVEPEVRWLPDVAVFLDQMGAFLERLTDAERLRFMREETRRIFDAMRPIDAQESISPEEAEEARRAMQAAKPAAKSAEPQQRRGKRRAG